MPTVTASVGISIEMWEKTRRYNINRSAISGKAFPQEIDRIEKEIEKEG